MTVTTAETNVTPGSLRIRIVNERRLMHLFADGSVKAFVAEIGCGADGVATGVTVGGVTAGGVTAGGVIAGGVNTGGVSTGGVNTGGVSTGGVSTGGVTGGAVTSEADVVIAPRLCVLNLLNHMRLSGPATMYSRPTFEPPTGYSVMSAPDVAEVGIEPMLSALRSTNQS
ncbi:MAG TPA: hypothetical protein VI318_00355 [Baekduia sp.]